MNKLNTNRTILITGGTDGIGKGVALQVARPGDDVTIVGLNRQKGELAAAEIRQETGAKVVFASVDMSMMAAVDRFATAYRASHPRLDVLIHSAGVMMAKRFVTTEGLEKTFATQYLSRASLTDKLVPLLAASDAGKVLFVSGGRVGSGDVNYANLNGEKRYSAISAVANASRALSLYTLSLMRQHPELRIYNYGPGLVRTALGRNMSPWMNMLMRTVGRLVSISSTQAGSEIKRLLDGTRPSGFYVRGLKPKLTDTPPSEETYEQKLWQWSEEQLRKSAASALAR